MTQFSKPCLLSCITSYSTYSYEAVQWGDRKACSAKQSKVLVLSLWLLLETSRGTCRGNSKHSGKAQSSQHREESKQPESNTAKDRKRIKSRRTEAETAQQRRSNELEGRSKSYNEITLLFTHLSTSMCLSVLKDI